MEPAFTTRPELTGSFGMVASTHWLASAVGMAVLEKGGNAFDAAVAAGFVLEVVEPHLNGPAGDAPILAWDAAAGRAVTVCGQGPAPAGASIQVFRELGLDLVPGTGLLAACVPGAVGAWLRLLADHGTLPLRDVLGYAIGYAHGGFPVVHQISETIGRVAGLFREHWPTSAATWLVAGEAPAVGGTLRNPVLGATFQRLLAEAEAASGDRLEQIEAAHRAFYGGFVADEIVAFCAGQQVLDSSGRRHRGLLTADDLAGWRPPVEDPVALDYAGYTVLKAGSWSQGPVLLQQLALLRGLDLADVGPLSAEFVHVVTESAKLAYADREAFYGDPLFVDVPLAELLSRGYNDERRRLLGEHADVGPLRPGSPGGRPPRLADLSGGRLPAGTTVAGAGEPTIGTADAVPTGDTCHVDVVDRWGNMVSATPSGGWLQSSPVIPSLGFALGTRAQMFFLDEGLPNSLAPGKRPRTTLTPSLALRSDGRPSLAFGTPGGDGQDQWQLQFFLRHVHHGMNLQEAIDAPAFQTMHFPSSFYPRESAPGRLVLEDRFPPAVLADLRARGHRVELTDGWSLGRLSAVSRDAQGVLRAAANARGMQGYAAGR
jgi:gamma-glutamyltranspeptidase / glutathione hydrolase